MPLKLPSITDTFKVVLRAPVEGAVSCSSEEYDQYLKTLDESYLKLTAEPTRFVMRKVLPSVAQASITDAQFKVDGAGKFEMRMSFMAKEVQHSIIGIENPEGIPEDQKIEFKRSGELGGGVHEDILAMLNAAGVVNDLYQARQTAIAGRKDDILKKK